MASFDLPPSAPGLSQPRDTEQPVATPPLLVVSPHLHCAALACGRWIAAQPGSVVVTVFTGTPQTSGQASEYDRRSGFHDAARAMQARRVEDARALALLRAQPRWLDFIDPQYGVLPDPAALAQALAELLLALQPQRWLYPLGLYHADHLLVHRACREAARQPGMPPGLAYEDAVFRGMPGVLQQRLAALAADGVQATPARLVDAWPHARAKVRALNAYASQRRAAGPGGWDDAAQPERAWQLDPQRPGHGRHWGAGTVARAAAHRLPRDAMHTPAPASSPTPPAPAGAATADGAATPAPGVAPPPPQPPEAGALESLGRAIASPVVDSQPEPVPQRKPPAPGQAPG